MRRYVHGVRRRCRDHRDVILCHVLVVKRFVICVRNHGSQITKIISNAISIKNYQIRL